MGKKKPFPTLLYKVENLIDQEPREAIDKRRTVDWLTKNEEIININFKIKLNDEAVKN